MTKITLTEESGTPSTPSAGAWKIFFKADGFYYLDDTGVEVGPISGEGNYLRLEDQKANNTMGGTNTPGAWTVRDLNTIARQKPGPLSAVTIGSNQFTLPAGEYKAEIWSRFFNPMGVIMRLYDTTTPGVAVNFMPNFAESGGHELYHSNGYFTLANSSLMQLEYLAENTVGSNDLGNSMYSRFPAIWGDIELYTILELWKVG
jgi:hypothetical protein